MNCINIKSKEFLDLQKRTNIETPLLAAKIKLYQDSNNTENYPTVLELLGDSFDVIRNDRLLPILENNIKEDTKQLEELTRLGLHPKNINTSPSILTNDSLDKKISKLQSLLNAVVIKDYTLNTAGRLLSSDHPLSKRHKKPVILINPDSALNDTVEHEFSHILIELLGNNPLLKEALDFAITTPEHKKTLQNYPELSDLDASKETLASLMGTNLSDKLSNSLEQLTTFRKILDRILQFFTSTFGIKKSTIVDTLNSQFLSNQLTLDPVENFNNTIDRNQKFVIDKEDTTSQSKVVRFINNMNDTFSLNNDTHIYTDKNNNAYNTSVTSLLDRIYGNHAFKSRLGSDKLQFEPGFLSTYEFGRALTTNSKIPLAYDQILNDMFNNKLIGINPILQGIIVDGYWHTYFMGADTNERGQMIALIDEHKELLEELAQAKETKNRVPAESGSYIHALVQDYIEGKITEFPSNVEDSIVLTNELDKIIARSKKEGTVLIAETTIFSANTNTPGQIDLLEITKDGKFRIYDIKTVEDGIYEKVTTNFIARAYMNQQISYSLILESYGLEPVNSDPMNVILLSANRSSFNTETNILGFNRAKTFNINPSDSAYISSYKSAKRTLSSNFMSKKIFTNHGIKTLADKAIDVNNEVTRVIEQYAIDSGIRNPLEAKFKQVGNHNIHMRKLYSKLQKIQKDTDNKLSPYLISDFVDAFIDTARSIEETGTLTTKNAFVDSDFMANLRNFDMLGPMLGNLNVLVNDLLLDESGIDIGEDVSKVSNKLKEAINYYNVFKDDYKQKRIEVVATLLANNSFMSEGLAKEAFEEEARKNGLTSREDIDTFITNKLSAPTTKAIIEKKELEYWVDRFNNGFSDLSFFYKHLADPGINKSLVVQVVKTILDRADQNIRYYVDQNMPELIKFEKTLKLEGFTAKDKYSKFLTDLTPVMSDVFIKGGLDKEVVDYYKTVPSRLLISEETSYVHEYTITVKMHYDYYTTKIKELSNGKGNTKQIEEYREKLSELRASDKEFKTLFYKANTETKLKRLKKVPNPAFTKLSEKDKEYLRYFTKHIKQQEEQISEFVPISKRLVTESYSPSNIDNKDSYRISLVELPKITRSSWENGLDVGATIKDKIEGLKDNFRPSGDDADFNYGTLAESKTDIAGREVNDIPLFYRNDLADPSLQSYDIPTMLALNMHAVQQFKEYRMVEADTTLLVDAVRDSNVIAKDSMFDVTRRSKNNKEGTVKVDTKALVTTLENSLKNRMYSKRYASLNSKGAYRTAKFLEKLKGVTSDVLLILNYNSAVTTSFQGTLYRFIEGFSNEHFSNKDVVAGSAKAWKDYNNVTKDIIYSNYPTSKSMLLIRKFGLEPEYQALTRKFVQNNTLTKSLDKGQLYAFTTMAEYLVTSSLMYSVMNNIKVMNKNKEYIDKDGKVVSKDKAMTLDEAYTLVDGKLELDKNVAYTSRNLLDKFVESNEGDNTTEALRVGLFISGLYKNLYGQYDNKLKSNLEMSILGESLVHLRKWAIRGTFNRFSGITSTIGLSFEERRDIKNLDKRYFSQELGIFKEGYVTTTFSYVYNVFKQIKDAKEGLGGLVAAHKTVYGQMTSHERANIKRTITELIAGGLLAIAVSLLMRLAYMDGEDDDEAIWFMVYSFSRVRDEALFFYNPYSAGEITSTPVTGMSILDKVGDLLGQTIGYNTNYRTGDTDWNFNDIYESGPHKGQYKVFKKSLDLVPGKKKAAQMLNLLGITEQNSSNSFKHTAEYMNK